MLKKTISLALILLILITPAFALDADSLVPIGHTTGIKLFAKGVIVADVAANQGGIIEKGDIIEKINETPIKNSEDFKEKVRKNGNKPISLTLNKNGKEKKLSVTPVRGTDGEYKLGIWVRDSMAGIGTVTFYHPESGTFGALGHGVCDGETGILIPLKKGSVMESEVREVIPGKAGNPGELKGEYNLKEDYGMLFDNTNSGIFGKIEQNVDFLKGTSVPVAKRSEIKCGPATILSNIEGNNVCEYQIEIAKIYPSNEKDTKNMLIKITDKKLIQKTGGIVQGMSGSPIIQNGKLVGAITHVLVNDPTRGYGIFIENMLSAAG